MPRLYGGIRSPQTGSDRSYSGQQLINTSGKQRRAEEVTLNVLRHPFNMISQQVSADEDNRLRTRLCSLLASGRESDFLRMLDVHRPRFLDASCASGCTMLQQAATGGHARAVGALLGAGADPNAAGCFKRFSAPLITAARLSHVDVLERLLVDGRKKIKVNATDASGNTALHYAALEGQVDSVAKLLQAGADPGIRNRSGRVALSAKQVRQLYQSCVTSNDVSDMDENFKIVLNFKMFFPTKDNERYSDQNQMCFTVDGNPYVYAKGKEYVNRDTQYNEDHTTLHSEMEVIRKLSVKNMKGCLDHPLIQAYLELKWRPLKYILYLDFLFHVLYFILVNTFCVTSVESMVDCVHNSNINSSLFPDHNKNNLCLEVERSNLSSATLIVGVITLLREIRRLYCVRDMYSTYEYCFLLSLFVNVVSVTLIFTQEYVSFLVPVVTSICILAFLFQRSPFHSSITRAVDSVSRRFVLFLISQIAVILAYVLILYVWNRSLTAQGYEVDSEGLGYFNTFGGTFVNILLIMTGSLELKTSNMIVKSAILYIMFSGILIFSLMTAVAISDMKSIKKEVSIKCTQNRIFLITECESLLVWIHKLLRSVPCMPKYFLGFSRRVNVFDNDSGLYYVRPNVTFGVGENATNSEISLPEETVNLLLNIINNKQHKESDSKFLKEFVDKQNRILEMFVQNMETKFAQQMDTINIQIRDTVLTTLREPIEELEDRINTLIRAF